MFGVLSVVFLGVLFFVALGFTFHYYGKNPSYALWWGVISAILAILGIGFYIQGFVIQPTRGSDSDVTTSDTARKDDARAWITIQSVRLKSPINSREPPTAHLVFTNTGKTPAVKCKVYYMLRSNETEVRYDEPAKPPGTIKSGNDDNVVSEAIIPPGVEYSADVGWNPPTKITDAEMAYFIANKLRTYVVGRIDYEDVFGRLHSTEFCFVNRGPDSIEFAPCSQYNTLN